MKHYEISYFYQELQCALRLLAIVEPMMEAAGRRGPNSGGLTPILRSCTNLLGFKQGILAVAQAAARFVFQFWFLSS